MLPLIIDSYPENRYTCVARGIGVSTLGIDQSISFGRARAGSAAYDYA